MSLIEMSRAGALLIALTILLRPLAGRCLPRRTWLVLWALALARLLAPITIPSRVSLIRPSAAPIAALPLLPTSPQPAPAPAAPLPPAAGDSSQALDPLWLLWLVTALALAALLVGRHLHGRLLYQQALPADAPTVQRWLAEQRLRRPLRVRVFDRIASPLTYGLLRPTILLPSSTDWQDEKQLAFILTHELVHIKRFDVLYKSLLALALCLHWFNPLIWLMVMLANRDLELCCDEAVLRRLGDGTGYALTLVALAEQSSASPLVSHFSHHRLRERIVAIMKYKPASLFAVFLAALLVVAIAIAFNTTRTAAPVAAALGDTLTPQQEQCVITWAEALDRRDGRARYDLMSRSLQQAFIDQQIDEGCIWDEAKQECFDPATGESVYIWSIGVSSPWVVSYDYQYDPATGWIAITYRTMDSSPAEYVLQNVLTLTEEDGQWKVATSTESAAYLPTETYEQAQEIQAAVDEGHQSWRLDPVQVAQTFLRNELGIFDFESSEPWDEATGTITYHCADGELTVTLYQPLLRQHAFWAVYAYELNDVHHNVTLRLRPE